MGYSIKLISDDSAFEGLKEAWSDLAAHCDYKFPFNTYEWCRSWWDAFGYGKELFILAVYENEKTIGIAPFTRRCVGTFRILEFISPDRADYLDFIVMDGCRNTVLERIGEYLNVNYLEWDLLILNNIFWNKQDESIFSMSVQSSRLDFLTRDYIKSPCLPIHGTWEEFLTSAGKMKKIRKKEKRLLSNGDIDVIHLHDYLDNEKRLEKDVFEVAKELEKHTWKYMEGNPRLQTDDNAVKFFKSVLKRFADRGWLDSWFVLVDGIPRAYAFSFAYNNKIFAYNSGYDIDFEERRLGSLMLINRIRDAFNTQMSEYDFLRGEEDYKFEWTDQFRKLKEYAVFNRRFRSKWLARLFIKTRWFLAGSDLLKKIRYKFRTFNTRRRLGKI